MNQTVTQILEYVYGIWRFRWKALLVAWIIAPIGWGIVAALPDTYESTAQIYVDTDTILKPLLRGISIEALDTSEQFGLMSRELLNRRNLERIAKEVGFDENANTLSEKEAVISKLIHSINIEATRTHRPTRPEPPNLYILTAHDKDPQIAYEIVKTLIDIFVEGSLGSSREETDVAQRFLENEIKEYEQKLTAAENRLREFKRKHIKSLPEQGTSYYQRLQLAQSNLESIELELREQQYRKRELLRQLRGTNPSTQIVTQNGTFALSPVDQRIMTLQSRLDELLLKYTEEHPDVVEAKNTLAEIKREKQSESKEGVSANNPVYQQIRLALGEVEANIAATVVRRNEYRKRVQELERLVETLPQIEAELKALNRNYEINKTNYDALVARRESVSIAENVEQTGEQVKIKVIEPPRIPIKPAAPNRLVLSTIVFLLSAGAGVGVAFLFSQLKPVIYSRDELLKMISLPVIGLISFNPTREVIHKKNMSIIGYSVMSGMLFLSYCAVIIFHIKNLA
jgi:polysaccharide chain length determinant protein (PEP-CTERM system associated)